MTAAPVVERLDGVTIVTLAFDAFVADYAVRPCGAVEVVFTDQCTRWAEVAASAPELMAAARDVAEGHAPAVDVGRVADAAADVAADDAGLRGPDDYDGPVVGLW